MRLISLLVIATCAAAPARAQLSSAEDQPSRPADGQASTASGLPVSLDKIKEGLEQTPTIRLRGLDEIPTFKVQIYEPRKPFELEEFLKGADLKPGPIPAGGLYANEMRQQFWHTSDSPLMQPYAAFNQPELLTILVENLVGQYLVGRAINAVSSAERAHAETRARDELRRAVADYCAAQPDGGRGVVICSSPIP